MRSSPSRFRRGRACRVLLAALSGALLLAGCGSSGIKGGSLTEQDNPVDLSGQSYTVGGKNTDSQQILCEIAGVALQSVGAEVKQRCNLGDTQATRQALVSGGIDMYWEETGTAWTGLLNQPHPEHGMAAQYSAVRQMDAQNKIVWLEATWYDPTDGIAVSQQKAKELKLQTVSDMAGYLRSGKPGTLCVDSDYQRAQLAGLQQAYHFQLPPGQQRVLPGDQIYQAVAGGQDCMFGKVTAGDPRMAKDGLTLLVDDAYFHTARNESMTVRKEVFDRNSDIARVFTPIARKLTDPVMAKLREEMASGKSAHQVAVDWLNNEGFVQGGD